jgi:MraZ protein
MFQGAALLSLDAKGRMSVPARHRDALTSGNGTSMSITITRSPDGCLMLFPQSQWLLFREKITALPVSAQWWKRVYLGNAVEVEIDSGGRVLISPELREEVGLSKDVRLVGMGNYFEIWDAATYRDKQDAAIKEPLPTILNDLSF